MRVWTPTNLVDSWVLFYECTIKNKQNKKGVFVMSKGKKQQYKQFTINTLEDACTVLKSLIVSSIIELQRFEDYSVEAEDVLQSCDPSNNIPVDIYDSLHDKIIYRQRELLSLMADHQSSSFSYIKVREILEKKNFVRRNLSEESRKTLKELLDIRNWSFHNVQSMLVADLEITKKTVPHKLRDIAEIRPMINPVIIRKVKDYEWKMLEGFTIHNKIRDKQFRLILSEMKEDYQEMVNALPVESYMVTCQNLNRNVKYIEQIIPGMNAERAGSKIAIMSMGIQKGKYDGTTEMYEKIMGKSGTVDNEKD